MGNLRDEHDEVVDRLRRFVPGAGTTVLDLILAGSGKIAAESLDISNATNESLTSKVQRGLLDLVNGGKYTSEILQILSQALAGQSNEKINEIARFVRITLPKVDADAADDIIKKAVINSSNKYQKNPTGDAVIYSIDDIAASKATIKNPKRDEAPIVIYELLSPHIGLNVRDSAPVSIGCSLMTPTAMSRCVPYLNARIFINSGEGSNIDETGKTNGFNLVHFLRGPTSAEDMKTLSPMVVSLIEGKPLSAPGMELFTSPQTMITHPDDISNFSLGRRPIDRFRPLMSITGFSVQVASGGAGMIYQKSASMEIVLYDRGRLGEVAQLVTPGLYSKVQIEIEYGWSAIPSSAIADGSINVNKIEDDLVRFMNTVRVKEKYQVTTSNYKFEENGSVSISLGLFMTGASDAIMIPIINDTSQDSAQAVKRAIQDINQIFFKNSKVKDVFGDTVVGAVSSVDYTVTLDPEAVKKLLEKVDSIQKRKINSTSNDASEVSALLKKLYGNSQESLVNQYKSSMKTAVESKIANIKRVTAQKVFPSGNEHPNGPLALYVMNKSSRPYSDGAWVNFGSLITAFVAGPIASTKKFDEIQVMFGRFNQRAGFMRNLSIASFPLDSGKLNAAMSEMIDKKVNVTPSELVQMISDKFISNSSNYAYGFSDAFVEKDGNLEFNTETGQATQDKACEAAGILDKTIQIPSLRMYMETVPHVSKPGVSILRIHLIDETCSAFSTYHDILWSARESDSFFLENTQVTTKHPNFKQDSHPVEIDPGYVGSERIKIIESLKNAGAIQPASKTTSTTDQSSSPTIDASQIFTCNDILKIRDYFKRTLPSITYGAMNGMVTNIGVSSVSSPELATINIVNMDQNDSNSSPNAARSSGLPLQVFPAEVSIEMIGNPMLAFAQEYFVDIGTNTTMDNIYAVTGLDHKLDPGSFTTSLKMTLKPGLGLYQSQKRKIDKMSEVLNTIAGDLKKQEAQAGEGAAATAKKSQAAVAVKAGANVSKTEVTLKNKGNLDMAALWLQSDALPDFREKIKNQNYTRFDYTGLAIIVRGNKAIGSGLWAANWPYGDIGIDALNVAFKAANEDTALCFAQGLYRNIGDILIDVDMNWFKSKPKNDLVVKARRIKLISNSNVDWMETNNDPYYVTLSKSFLKSLIDPYGYDEKGNSNLLKTSGFIFRELSNSQILGRRSAGR